MSDQPNPPAPAWPLWANEIDRALPFAAQIVLYGAIHDLQLTPQGGGLAPMALDRCLWERLRTRGYEFALIFNGTSGLRVLPESAAGAVADHLPFHYDGGDGVGVIDAASLRTSLAARTDPRFRLDALPALATAVHGCAARCALVVEDASRLVRTPGQYDEEEHHILASCRRIMYEAEPSSGATEDGAKDIDGAELFNPTIWLTDGVRDLPDWLVIAGERSRALAVALPDEDTRTAWADKLASMIEPGVAPGDRADAVARFAGLSQGLSLREMYAVTQIAIDRQTAMRDIAEAVRIYKVGQPNDPWRNPGLRDRLKDEETWIRSRVKGQRPAVTKTLDVLKRAALGLSGAQSNSTSGRPRGVLFFAGPTGVGKTEMAKAISSLVFGSEDAYIRFDMSEFSSEHSDSRLIGSSPGFIGFDRGGELVNAVRERPFSVILFDEIEKAHPRILDKFLQILEDGRLTDGRGDTVYFSETIIVFTSNLGVSERRGSRVVQLLSPEETDYNKIEEIVRNGIRNHFENALQRPELYNRIGEDNIIVFEYIRETVANEIFQKNLDIIKARFRATVDVDLNFEPAALAEVRKAATSNTAAGGRGVGTTMETAIVNAVVRDLFERDNIGGPVTVTALMRGDDKMWKATLA